MAILKWIVGITLAGLHLKAYADYYINILLSFSVTFIIKRLIKSMGNTELAGVFGLGGYSLGIVAILNLFRAVLRKGLGVNIQDIDMSQFKDFM